MGCASGHAVEVPSNKHGDVGAGCNLFQALQEGVHLQRQDHCLHTPGLFLVKAIMQSTNDNRKKAYAVKLPKEWQGLNKTPLQV